MKDVLRCIIAISGEQFVIMDSLTQRLELFVALSDSGMFRLGTLLAVVPALGIYAVPALDLV